MQPMIVFNIVQILHMDTLLQDIAKHNVIHLISKMKVLIFVSHNVKHKIHMQMLILQELVLLLVIHLVQLNGQMILLNNV